MRPRWLEQPEIWVILVLLGAVVVAGGGTPIGVRGVILALVGAWVCLRPPVETPSRLFEGALLALLAIGIFSSFAPVSWLGRVAWRDDLARMGVALPATNATAPWLAAESVAQLVAGIVWLYVCWNLRLNHGSRKLALWSFAVLAALLSLVAAYGNLLHAKYPLATESVNFSFFPNRNQSALWYCLGGVVSFGLMVECLHRRRKSFVFAGVLLAPCVLALVLGHSRMAMALFTVGTVAAVWVRLGRDGAKYILQLLLPLAVVSLTIFFVVTDGQLYHPIPTLGTDRSSAPDFRLLLWHDTLVLAKNQPAGVGLGQFAQVYPQYRNFARTYQTVRHPDSDWFWLLGETGWVGLLAALVAVGALARRFLSKDGRANGPYRNLAMVCAGLFLMHSLVDVPAHRFGTWLLVCWLLGIAAPDAVPAIPTRIPRLVWRSAGIGLFALGIAWVAAQAGAPLNSTLSEERQYALSQTAEKDNDSAGLLSTSTNGAALQPLQWWPYFQRARAELLLDNNPNAAQSDFRIASFLEPTWSRVPYTEGLLWAPTNHLQAFAAWREALHREDATPEGLWRDIYEVMRSWPDCDDYATLISKTRPLFRWEFLSKEAAAKRIPKEMADELERDPKLAQYTPVQRKDILERWATCDPAAALAYLYSHPSIVRAAWQVEMAANAAARNFSEAIRLARANLPTAKLPNGAPHGPADEASLRLAFTRDPTYLTAAIALLHMEIDAEKYDAALATLNLLAKQPKPPTFVSWWQAELLARQGKMEDAWLALQPYLNYERNLPPPKP